MSGRALAGDTLWNLILCWLLLFVIDAAICSSVPPPDLLVTGSPPAHLTWRDVHQDYFAVINEGETLRLNCSVVGDVDEQRRFELNWFLPNAAVEGRLHHDKDKHGNFFSVEVLNAEPDDYGQYKCTGRPDYGYHSEYVEDVERLNAVENAATVTVKVVPRNRGACGPSSFHCKSKPYCIFRRYVCDGVMDCTNGEDEDRKICGADPCRAKLRCDDQRCLDPSQCCSPSVDPFCIVHECCKPFIEANRRLLERERQSLGGHQYTPVFNVLGGVLGCLGVVVIIYSLLCHRTRFHGGEGGSRLGSRPPLTMHELDLYFASLYRGGRQSSSGNGGNGGITYNINNGVQFVAAASEPPSYAAAVVADPPPPYAAAATGAAAASEPERHPTPPPPAPPTPPPEEGEEDDEEREFNNNGDINGNSEMVNQNIVREEEERRNLLAGQPEQQAQVHGEGSGAVLT